MFVDVITARRLIRKREELARNSGLGDSLLINDFIVFVICQLTLEELPEFLVSDDELVRTCATERLTQITGS